MTAHAVVVGGDRRGCGAAGVAGGEGGGRGAKGAGGGWPGGAHVVCGLKLGALGDEVLEAAELASDSRLHQGRNAPLRSARGGVSIVSGRGGEGEASEVARGGR